MHHTDKEGLSGALSGCRRRAGPPGGGGNLSLAYWREVHERFFRQEMEEAGLVFDEDMLVVCEEFSCVYTKEFH